MTQSDALLPERPLVLLVDDDEVNLMLTSMALRERGFEIVEVASGEQALDKLAGWTPDLILLDAQMPGLDGFEVCRCIRSQGGLEQVPVLMLTGLDDDVSVARAYQAGATDFFVKAAQWGLLAQRLFYMLRSARTRLELERSRARLARAQDLAHMGSFDWIGARGAFVLQPEARHVLGLLARDERFTLRQLLAVVIESERRALVRLIRERLTHSSVLTADLTVRLPDGRRRIVHVEAEPEFNEHGQCIGYTGVLQDVTDRHAAQDEIRHLANFDALTGLPNRHQLIARAERALDQARQQGHSFAMLLIDLDRFKNINDTLGHAAGDELLRQVSHRLRGCVRHSDHLIEGMLEAVGGRTHRALEAVGRLGGDEFVALLPEVGESGEAVRVADRMLDVMHEPFVVAGQECFVTTSIGMALFPRDGDTVVDLLRNADVAMYSVKAQGRNGAALYSPALSGAGRQRLELETALHKAIERDELRLHFQPLIDVRQGRMIGVEALMRWQRGDKLMPPSAFIPLAEDSGLIVPMSEWALRESARQARVWRQRFGFDGTISVNLPTTMFTRSDLVETIHEAVSQQGVPHSALRLEITEDSLMKDLQSMIPSLHRLNEIGVEVSIDDFGTGSSSLARLSTLPIAELKIDREFVRDLGITPQSPAIVSAIVALGKSLGLRVVAEGVEMLRQMEVLQRLGCNVMQGFMFCRPMPGADLEQWLETAVLPRADALPTRLTEVGTGSRRH